MQLKAFIKKKAEENHISAQLVMQNYMMERLLERISLSKYRKNFILKGGFLIAAIVGLETRTTMDLDTTIKGFPITHESIGGIFNEVCNIHIEDDITFSVFYPQARQPTVYNAISEYNRKYTGKPANARILGTVSKRF